MTLSGTILLELLFLRTLAGYAAIIALAALFVAVRWRGTKLGAYASMTVWIIAFTISDVMGYEVVVLTDGSFNAVTAWSPGLIHSYQVALNGYRIVQMTLQVTLTFLVFFAAGWRPALGSLLFWWGGGCDLLYYLLRWEVPPSAWDWMGWTPAGMFFSSLTRSAVFVQATVMAVTAVLVAGWKADKRAGKETG